MSCSLSWANDRQNDALIIYNILNFVQWPDSAFADSKASIKVCLYGNVEFAEELGFFQGVPVRGRFLNFFSSQQLSAVKTGCHMLFVGIENQKELPMIFSTVQSYYVLSVGRVDGFVNAGGVLNILRTSDQRKFEINLDKARKNGLSLSSDLLELARVINQ